MPASRPKARAGASKGEPVELEVAGLDHVVVGMLRHRAKEEVAEEKAAAKKKAEEERLSRLSAADQKKVCLSIFLKVYLSNEG